MKKVISIFLMSLLLMLSTTGLFAETKKAESSEVASLSVSKSSVSIKFNGASEFIDVIAEYKNGTKEIVNDLATWKSMDQDVVVADNGRILATGKGETEVTVDYNGKSKVIKVQVLKKVDLEAMMQEALKYEKASKKPVSTLSLSDSERDAITSKASSMFNTTWVPTQNLTGYKGNYTYYQGTTYRLPYSQTEYQKDDVGFNAALNSSDFYSNYTRFGYVMPKYGNDCSAFVSFAFGISRQTTYTFIDGIRNGTYPKVGSYSVDSPAYSELISSYPLMQSGDAITNTGHSILIAGNYSDWCICYEQTPPQVAYTYYDHAQLANQSYRPFSKK